MSATRTTSAATRGPSAMAQGLVMCHDCGLLVKLPGGAQAAHDHGAHDHAHPPLHCPRCHAKVHARKAGGLQRTWALLIAATLLYIPANLLPIMKVSALGSGQADTIMSGVMHLLHGGMWPLALVVFFASVAVPMAKLFALAWLLISVQRNSTWRPVERTRVYRLTELLGRWSMVDIYVVTILAALVQVGALAEVEARAGAIYFGATVVVTMLAAESFDPRLIWDRLGDADQPGETDE